jgi:O-acetyl-ADP-ribose deacetylase (regulator of RNase III)
MIQYEEKTGDLIAEASLFDVVVHGCNCFCRMKRGIAPLMAKAFGVDTFPKESAEFSGDFNKLGTIDYQKVSGVFVVNAYAQYHWKLPSKYGFPLDYDALRLCLRKINHRFTGLHVAMPKIGCGLAGGDWNHVTQMIQEEMEDCKVTVLML